MKVSGRSHLSADRDAVWRALNDPAVLVRTIPGCQRLEAVGEDAYKMTVAAGVGAVKGVYDGEVRLTEQQQPGSFRMRAQGAGPPGTIGADVVVTLADGADGGTELSYDADAVVGGMIGGVGQRMLTGVSKKMAAEFFSNVENVLAGAVPAGASAEGRTGEGIPAGLSAGQVFTAPQPAGAATAGGPGFLVGALVGAGTALAGVLVGAWIAGRRRR
jgi:carbon monoxide dehydrogenase subunit G